MASHDDFMSVLMSRSGFSRAIVVMVAVVALVDMSHLYPDGALRCRGIQAREQSDQCKNGHHKKSKEQTHALSTA